MPKPRPPHLIREKARGKYVWYVRIGKSERVRVRSEFGTEPFWVEYRAAIDHLCRDGAPTSKPSAGFARGDSLAQKVEASLKVRFLSAKGRAKDKERDFSITLDWLLAKARRQGFRCELTGVRFFSEYDGPANRNPYAPSLDKIDPRGGYTPDNTRILCVAANIMLQDWGEDVLRTILRSYRGEARGVSVDDLAANIA